MALLFFRDQSIISLSKARKKFALNVFNESIYGKYTHIVFWCILVSHSHRVSIYRIFIIGAPIQRSSAPKVEFTPAVAARLPSRRSSGTEPTLIPNFLQQHVHGDQWQCIWIFYSMEFALHPYTGIEVSIGCIHSDSSALAHYLRK